MTAFERACLALAALELSDEARRERVALAVLAVLEAHAEPPPLSPEALAALDGELSETGRMATDEEMEAIIKTLMR